jgi:hypothetical protein
MARKKKFQHEWHLYSLAIFIIMGTIFFFTAFDILWASVGTGLIAAMSGLFATSDNWKHLVTSSAHKVLIEVILALGFLWFTYLACVNKLFPYLFEKE